MSIWLANIMLLLLYKTFLSTTRLNNYKQNSLLIITMFFQYMFLYIFKDNYIFNDIWAHLISFEHSKTVGWKELYKIRDTVGYLNYELGWRYYVKILSTLSSNDVILIFATGFIIIYSYSYAIYKYSIIPWLS